MPRLPVLLMLFKPKRRRRLPMRFGAMSALRREPITGESPVIKTRVSYCF
jgi:hypothetical protein